MVQATHGDARDVCALTVTARPVGHDIAAESERFWTTHIGAAAAAMLAPVVVVAAFATQPRRIDALRREPPAAKARAPSRSVVGRILDVEGRPAAHASVRAAVGGVGAGPAELTDGEGRFRLDGLGGQKFRLLAEDDADGFVESAELDADNSQNVVLVLAHARAVSGVVVDERSVPVSRATVKSWGGSAASERVMVTDEEGRFLIDHVAPDAKRVTAWAQGYEPSTTVLQARANGAVVFDLTLRAAHPIRGVVTGPKGRPVPGARITACEEQAAEAAVSDAAGAFELPAATAGCLAKAAHPRFSTATPVSIEPGRALVLRLAAGGAIEGAAIDDAGRPVNSFSIIIDSFEPAEGESNDASRAGETRAELRGRFRLDDLAAGTYVIHATTPEGLESPLETIELARGKVEHGVSLVFPKPDVVSEAPSEGAETSETSEP